MLVTWNQGNHGVQVVPTFLAGACLAGTLSLGQGTMPADSVGAKCTSDGGDAAAALAIPTQVHTNVFKGLLITHTHMQAAHNHPVGLVDDA